MTTFRYRRRKNASTVVFRVSSILFPFFLFLITSINAQIGVDICACQPATYTFTFDFSLTCADTNVTSPGIIPPPGCLTEIRGQENVNKTELVPLSVQTIQIYELDQNLQVVAQTVREGNYLNGSTFVYTSIIATQSDKLNPTTLPQGLQLSITGLNSQEQSVIQTYIIRYNNDCGIFPVLFEGDTAGWTIFTDLGNPPQTVCPLAPSSAPTGGSDKTGAPKTATPKTGAPTVSKPLTVPPFPNSTTAPSKSPTKPSPVRPVPNPPVIEPTCAPLYQPQYSAKAGKGMGMNNGNIKTGKGNGETKKMKIASLKSMAKLSRKNERKGKRWLRVHNKPNPSPSECPEPTPVDSMKNAPSPSQTSSSVKRPSYSDEDSENSSKITLVKGETTKGGSSLGRNEPDTKFNNKKTKISDALDKKKEIKDDEKKGKHKRDGE